MSTSFTRFDGRIAIEYDREYSNAVGSDHWRVNTGFHFYIGNANSAKFVAVPTGFRTDGASVPKFLWSFIPPWGVYGNAAIVHDYLCDHRYIIADGVNVPVNNKTIDDIFYEAMKVSGVPWYLRQTIYLGVRAADFLKMRSTKPVKS